MCYPRSLWIRGGLVALCGRPAMVVGGRTEGGGSRGLEVEQRARDALREASTHRGYWLLNAGFFVCGFHIAFIATHLPAYLDDKGLGIEKIGRASCRERVCQYV